MASNQYHTLVLDQHHRFSAAQIGHTVMIGAASQIILPWLVLYASRWVQRPDSILRGAYLGLAFSLLLFPHAPSQYSAMIAYWGAIVSLNVAATLQTTMILAVARPLGDHWVLALRSAGTLGYALSSLVCSTFADAVGYTNLYWLFALAGVVAFAGSWWAGNYIPAESRRVDFRSVLHKLADRETRILVGGIALANIAVFGGTAIIGNFIYHELHGTPRQVGVAWTIATFTEFPLIWLTIPVYKRFGLKATLLTGVVSSTLRMGLVWLCTDLSWFYLIQMFHGLFFGTTLSTVGLFFARRHGVESVHGLQLAGQSIYGGMASALGGQLAGVIWSHWGIRNVYLVDFLLLLTALTILVFFFKVPPASPDTNQ